MPSEKLELRVSLTTLLTVVLLTVIPICAVGLYTLTRAETAIDRNIGNHFRTIAQSTAGEVSSFLDERLLAVGTLAASPSIVEAVTAADKPYTGMTDDAIRDRIQKIEKGWNTPASEPFVREMLGNRASHTLDRWRDRDRRFLRLTLTDSHGGVIAATHKTLDFYQADEDFWQAIYAQGRGAVHVTDILYDDVTKSYYLGLGVPVMDEQTNTFSGALDALIEVSSIFPILHRVNVGPTSRAILVKQDGTIIDSPTISLSSNMKSDEFLALRASMLSGTNRWNGYLVTTLPGGENVLVGYSDIGMHETFKNLGWTVLIVQNTREAYAATRGVMRLILFLIAVMAVLVVLLVVYFSLHRRREYTDLTPEEPAPKEPGQIPETPNRTETPDHTAAHV